MIRVEDLVKRYRKAETNAVDGISFQVKAGEFFVLLGPNGAGKTTTISILTTTLSPTSGGATIDGSDIIREASAVRRKVGIIFQRPSLDQNLTAEENVRFHAVLYGIFPYAPTYALMARGYRAKVEELARLLGIARDIHKPVKTFSGGMRRKLEIMRSLLHDPKVLFLDEPTAGLDVPTRRTLWEHLTEVRRTSGTTIFLTTHYLEEAEERIGSASSTKARSSRSAHLTTSSGTSSRNMCSSTRPTGPLCATSSHGLAMRRAAEPPSRSSSTAIPSTRCSAASRPRSAS